MALNMGDLLSIGPSPSCALVPSRRGPGRPRGPSKKDSLSLGFSSTKLKPASVRPRLPYSVSHQATSFESPAYPDDFGASFSTVFVAKDEDVKRGDRFPQQLAENISSCSRCAFCYMQRDSLLGQGESALYRPLEPFDPLAQRIKREQSAFNSAYTPPNQEYRDTLEDIGAPYNVDLRTMFTMQGDCIAHMRCASWSQGVRHSTDAVLDCVPESALKALGQVCCGCQRYGASVLCHICQKCYHFPCALAFGGLIDFKAKLYLCPEHVADATSLCNVCCAWCGEIGNTEALVVCTLCFTHVHNSCLDPPIALHPSLKAGWQCPECKLCQRCRTSGDDSKMLVCDVCDKGYHIYCIQPALTSIPKNGWKCQNCRQCSDCGSKTPGGGQSSRWHVNYSVCDSCYQQRNKGLRCPKCGRAYRHNHKSKSMLQCTLCRKFVHRECDPEASVVDYTCGCCQQTESGVTSPLPSSEEGDNLMQFVKNEVEGSTVSESESPIVDVEESLSGWDTDLCNVGEDRAASQEPCLIPSVKLKSTRGRRKKKTTSHQSLTSLASIGSTDSNRQSRFSDELYHAIVIASSKNDFVFSQDMCLSCGSYGQGLEGQLICCAQCGQCYHTYCANLKLTSVMITRGWRCLACVICEGCGKPDDDNRLLLCDDCDVSYHIYCLSPPLDHVPYGSWRCTSCVRCVVCGSSSPGLGCKWQEQYSKCALCVSLEVCLICRCRYADNDLIMECLSCGRWFHASCSGFHSEEAAERALEMGWRCSTCRPSGNATITASANRHQDSVCEYLCDGIILTAAGYAAMQKVAQNRAKNSATVYSPSQSPSPSMALTQQNSVVPTLAYAGTASIMDIIESVTAFVTGSDEAAKEIKQEEAYADDQLESECNEMADSQERSFSGVKPVTQRRPRRVNKIGVGGFSVRTVRQPQRMDEVGIISRERSLSIDNYGEDMMVVNSSEASDKPKRKRLPKKRGELQEAYPIYIQECFFGNSVMEAAGNLQAPATGSSKSLELEDLPPSEAKTEKPVTKRVAIKLPSNHARPSRTVLEDTDQGYDDQFNELNDCFPQDLPHDSELNGLLGMLFSEQGHSQPESKQRVAVSVEDEGCLQPLLGTDFESELGDDLETEMLRASRDSQRNNNSTLKVLELAQQQNSSVFSQHSSIMAIPVSVGQHFGHGNSLAVSIPAPSVMLSTPGHGHMDTANYRNMPPSSPMQPQLHHQSLMQHHLPQQQHQFVGMPPTPGIHPAPEFVHVPHQIHAQYANQVMDTASDGDWNIYPSPNAPCDASSAHNYRSRLEKWEEDEALGLKATISAVLYANTKDPMLRQRYPLWNDRVKIITKMWRELPEPHRAPYLHQAKENRALHRQELKKTEKTTKNTSVHSERDLSQPSPQFQPHTPAGNASTPGTPNPLLANSPMQSFPAHTSTMLPSAAHGFSPEHLKVQRERLESGSGGILLEDLLEQERREQTQRSVTGADFGHQLPSSSQVSGFQHQQQQPHPNGLPPHSMLGVTGICAQKMPLVDAMGRRPVQAQQQFPQAIGNYDIDEQVEQQQKLVESDLQRMKKQKKSILSRQRQLKKNNHELTDTDKLNLASLNQDIAEQQKKVDAVKKSTKQAELQLKQNTVTSPQHHYSAPGASCGGFGDQLQLGFDAYSGLQLKVPSSPAIDRASQFLLSPKPEPMFTPHEITHQMPKFSPHLQSLVSAEDHLTFSSDSHPSASGHSFTAQNPSQQSSATPQSGVGVPGSHKYLATNTAVSSSGNKEKPDAASGPAPLKLPNIFSKHRQRKKKEAVAVNVKKKWSHHPNSSAARSAAIGREVAETMRYLLDAVCRSCGESCENAYGSATNEENALLKQLLGDDLSSTIKPRLDPRTESSIADVVSAVVLKASEEYAANSTVSMSSMLKPAFNVDAAESCAKSSDGKSSSVPPVLGTPKQKCIANNSSNTTSQAANQKKRQRRQQKTKTVQSPQGAAASATAAVSSVVQQQQQNVAQNDEFQLYLDALSVKLAQLAPLAVQEPSISQESLVCPPVGTSILPDTPAKCYVEGSDIGHGKLVFMDDYYAVEFWKPRLSPATITQLPLKRRLSTDYTKQNSSAQEAMGSPNLSVQATVDGVSDESGPSSPQELVWSSSPEPDELFVPFMGLKPQPADGHVSPNFRLVAPVPFRPVPASPPSPDPFEPRKKQEHEDDDDRLVTVSLVLDENGSNDVQRVLQTIARMLNIEVPTQYDLEILETPPPTPDKDTTTLSQDSLGFLDQCCRQCGATVKEGVVCRNLVVSPSSKLQDSEKSEVSFCSNVCFVQYSLTHNVEIVTKPSDASKNFAASAPPSSKNAPSKPTVFLEPKIEPTLLSADVYGGPEREQIITLGSSINAKLQQSLKEGVPSSLVQVGLYDRKLQGQPKRCQRWKVSLLAQRSNNKPALADPNTLLLEADICMKPTSPDTRQCQLCSQIGDGTTNGSGRLLQMDADQWVHVNCALWSAEVYENQSGSLINVAAACRRGQHTKCKNCGEYGATLRCYRVNCTVNLHLPCAIDCDCTFFADKTLVCLDHLTPYAENVLENLAVLRKVYIERDENAQIAKLFQQGNASNLSLRVGSLIFHNIGQLLPHQLKTFHNTDYIYPVGYNVTRIYWSVWETGKRLAYNCTVTDRDGLPEFLIEYCKPGFQYTVHREASAKESWNHVLSVIEKSRESSSNCVKLFPQCLSGEGLFGLQEQSIIKMIESLPGVESLLNYEFKFGRSPLMDLPLAVNPSGCARCEPRFRTYLKRPHTLNAHHVVGQTASSLWRSLSLELNLYAINRQSIFSKYSQYRKMQSEWRSSVYLARSKIQGLGLYAAKDLDMNVMLIEYIGEVIRNEVAERREKLYQQQNRGIYMFRIDSETICDATVCGGPARYINHSCDPNCVAETVVLGDRDTKIVIMSNRPITKGEELTYDYQFDEEDDKSKIPCLCGAPNCKKWMN